MELWGGRGESSWRRRLPIYNGRTNPTVIPHFCPQSMVLPHVSCGTTESATNPRVVLVINNNIYIIGLILIASIFQKRSMIGMARTNGCGPLKILIRTRLASTRLLIFILVIQDHIESIGKANTIKRG